jgi:alpha-L-rhamnosidase
MTTTNLQTEYLYNPIGIDYTNPRLFWNCEGGVTQTAYRITAKDETGALLWDSGKVPGSSMRVAYNGKPLASRSRVTWQVVVWDENDTVGATSEKAVFELGLLKAGDWTAQWIMGDYIAKKSNLYPVDCFIKPFLVRKAVSKARLYITACGLYEAVINNTRVGDFILAPGITDYNKRIQYQTYDVTGLLKQGDNSLSVQLANGWYRGSTGAWGRICEYGTETKLLAQLEITYTDNSTENIITDKSWSWSNDGPIRFADNKDGEIVESFRMPSYLGQTKITAHTVIPAASNNVAMTEHERLNANLIKTPKGKTVLDFAQNIAGYIEFTLTAKKG